MAPPAVTLASANWLNYIDDASFPEIFISNINNIYAHEDSDISRILESKKKKHVKKNCGAKQSPCCKIVMNHANIGLLWIAERKKNQT